MQKAQGGQHPGFPSPVVYVAQRGEEGVTCLCVGGQRRHYERERVFSIRIIDPISLRCKDRVALRDVPECETLSERDEIASRLWTSTVVGRRSYRNTLALVRDVASRMTFTTCPLIVTDGFEFYGTVIRRVFGSAALYAQVIKTRRHDRVVRVDRRAVIGAAWRFDEALARSEDSSTVNTSFIERLNLTIRQGSAYLSRRTLSLARSTDTLDAHLELLRCYYNFGRPHGALKFGRETRTPAMQAGLATRRLTLRDIFLSLRRVILWLSDMRMFADLGVPTPAAVARSGSHDHHGRPLARWQ